LATINRAKNDDCALLCVNYLYFPRSVALLDFALLTFDLEKLTTNRLQKGNINFWACL